jgi:hypothetical protein
MSVNSFLEKLKQRVSPTPVDETGMWYQDKDVVVPSNKITMKGPEGEDDYFDEPIVGTGMQSGQRVVMQPGQDYEFPDDDAVYESKQMQLGGRINNISPEGNVDFSLGNKNKLAFNVRGSGNIPNFKLNSINPSLSYNNKGFNADVSPTSFGAGYNNSKVNLNANATVRNNAVESAGIQGSYNVTPNLSLTGNYNINKGEQGTDKNYFAGFRYAKSFQKGGQKKESSRSLVDLIPQITPGVNDVMDVTDIIRGAASGNKNQVYQGVIGMASPGLAGKAVPTFLDYVTEKGLGKEVADSNQSKREGIVNMSSSDLQKLYAKYGPGGYDKWKAAGFPKLQMGGMSIPGINGTVIASDNSPRLKKAYMQQAGYFKYVPPSQRPLTLQSTNPSTSDNTRVRNVKYNEPVAPVVTSKKPVTPSKLNPSLINRLAAISEAEERNYSDNTAVYSIPPMDLAKKAAYDLDEDYRQSKVKPITSYLPTPWDLVPTPGQVYLKSFAGQDNSTENFTEQQRKEMAYAIAKAEARESGTNEPGYTGSFGYGDYRGGYIDKEGKAHNDPYTNFQQLRKLDDKTGKRLKSVYDHGSAVGTLMSLGKANFKKHSNDEYLVHDVYDFDVHNDKNPTIADRLETIGYNMGVRSETNVAIPTKYVDEARKEIALENAKPKVKQPEEQTKPAVKSTREKAPVNVSKPTVQKSKLQQSYEQVKPSLKKTLTTTTQSKQTAPAKQTSSRNELNSEESNVQNYQRMLNSKYNAGLEADGAWGPKTQAAYEKYIKK